jgi:muramoyltetrapeptide carboxypeptidase
MTPLVSQKLRPGDEIRVIAPARSLSIISEKARHRATRALETLGFTVSFGRHAEEKDGTDSSSIASRTEDIHEAFADPQVKGILSAIGGFNSNQLFTSLDYDLIRRHPKVFCGYSDITALLNGLYAQTGLVTYLGPHYSTFGRPDNTEYTIDYFKKCLLQDDSFIIMPSESWNDNAWWREQISDQPHQNAGYHVFTPGTASGTFIGGNLATFVLLQGTPYQPAFKNSILLLEDDDQESPEMLDHNLQRILETPEFTDVQALVLGRFQTKSGMTLEKLNRIIASKPQLQSIPVIANVDFGHTDPKCTLPIGGTGMVTTEGVTARITITTH